MEKVIDGQFQRLEKALSTLVNSIATYNPNPGFATELVAADQELTRGLEQLSVHQQNYSRLRALRSTSATLDEQIRSTLTLLADTRAELVATPATVFPRDANPVSYSELLSYARRISKFTIPPTFREAAGGESGAAAMESQDAKIKVEAPGDQQQQEVKTNGSNTPVAMNGGASSNGTENNAAASLADAGNTTALPAAVSNWLNPLNDGPAFFPWPTEETIRRGALASIQILLDQGVDPATFDPERSAELEAERKRREEEQDRLREEQEAERQRAEMERRALADQRRRESGAGRPASKAQVEKPAVFTGLDLLDDMDEDDD
ncbi:MAG: hypothetical protein M1818_007101 [Claussenomyces sp. TS43310]|nr:MAG: hypothetical protein M1818_007101 [Claussenomyces sp. TS43310]